MVLLGTQKLAAAQSSTVRGWNELPHPQDQVHLTAVRPGRQTDTHMTVAVYHQPQPSPRREGRILDSKEREVQGRATLAIAWTQAHFSLDNT